MTLLVLSDSHGRSDLIQEAIRRVRPDGILFAGDGLRDLTYCDLPNRGEGCPLWAVSGNCDWVTSPLIINGRRLEPESEELVVADDRRILLMHGHKYGVKGGLGQAIARAVQREADVLVFGHTHIPLELHLRPHSGRSDFSVTKPLTVFNPGSLAERRATFGTLTVRGGILLCGHGEL